jgi:hypothetical protein
MPYTKAEDRKLIKHLLQKGGYSMIKYGL